MPDLALPVTPLSLEDRLDRVCGRVAPLWPLRDFVAVNPFLGLSDQAFGEAATTLRRVAGRDLLPPRAFFRDAIAEGQVTQQDLDAAGATAITAHERRPTPQVAASAATVADVLDWTLHTDRTHLLIGEIGKWCAAWTDEGQAAWPTPLRHLPFYSAWRAGMRHDWAPEVAGLRGFRAVIAALPEQPVTSIAACLDIISLSVSEADDYLHRALLSVAGWAGLFRQRGWPKELAGETDDGVLNLLAVRLAWDAALYRLHDNRQFRAAWSARLLEPPAVQLDLTSDLALLAAQEGAFRRALAAMLKRSLRTRVVPSEVQAVFCIDVRSEVYRRALETVAPQMETLGFAGFFGFAAEVVPIGETAPRAQCPVLLRPGMLVCEQPVGANDETDARLISQLGLRRQVADLWTAFRSSAVSCFTYVEAVGVAASAALLRAALRRTPAVPAGPSLELDLTPRDWHGRHAGLTLEVRVDAAEAMLRGMSLTSGFAGLVLLVGHGARVVNNPHAAGLDCGACGGHSGESNARIAAAVMNDPAVRQCLATRGISIPDETWFLAAVHETVTDEVRILDTKRVPPRQIGLLTLLQARLAEAAGLARAERAPLLGLPDGVCLARETRRRGVDWSEVRPEWALAGNAAFIAAPRARTAGLDLRGRAFLHSYDWRADQDFAVLELIMTAPMLVASWINLQYYGSTVDNAAWGSGNKVLHNVVGLLGVLEGQAGDLRAGLPWQSVHDGTRFVHEPLRLSVLIEAPPAAMDAVLARHVAVRQLVENGWLHLSAIDDTGGLVHRRGTEDWVPEAVTSSLAICEG